MSPKSVKRRVVAIGLDSAAPELIDRWMQGGLLPNLHRMRQAGVFCRLENAVHYQGGKAPYASTEGLWVTFQTGVRPNTSGYWETVQYDHETYSTVNDPVHGGYKYREFAPFFALGNDYRVATLDIPVSAVCTGVNGLQVVGWGGHFPFVERGSQPSELFEEITTTHGKNEILYHDYGVFWKQRYLKWLEETSVRSVQQRTDVCLDLLRRERWDLFLAVFGESHGASHDLWFASQPDHPLHDVWKGNHDPLLRVFQAIDQAVGTIADEVAADTYFLCFSVHGMQSNVTDVASFFLLPELLYRFNFPGRSGFAAGDSRQPPRPPFSRGRHWYWFGEVWRRKTARGPLRRTIQSLLPGWLVWPPGKDLRFPYPLRRLPLDLLVGVWPPGKDLRFPTLLDWFGRETGWMPAVWYQPAWPRMRSFALPAFSDGHVRINLQGREARGIVTPDQYTAECDRVAEFLLRVRHGRTGKPVVRDVVRTRRSGNVADPRLPHADLIVVWENVPVDVVDSPDVGRIGPVPFYRTGGHCNSGFVMAQGPGIEPHKTLAPAETVDLAPTILAMLNAPVPSYLEGRSLLDPLHVGVPDP